MHKFFFKHIDNSGLIVFRIVFGLLCFLESVGAVFTGWVKRTLVEPEFTFSFIGFEWLQPLPSNWMYAYYIIMGVFGLLIMVGYKYRISMLMFALMWTATYLMQKSSYNNHYYLLFLLSFLMVLLPAHKYASVDATLNPKLKAISMPNWCRWVFIIQLFILYTYASTAKLYGDWLDSSVVALLMQNKANYPIIGELLQNPTLHYLIAYGGILFDGLIIPLLLFILFWVVPKTSNKLQTICIVMIVIGILIKFLFLPSPDDWGEQIAVDTTLDNASESNYNALLLPGGVINPDKLRTDDNALGFIRSFFDSGKPVAAICHAPWLLASANVVENRKITSYHSIKDDMINAGANWVDQEVVVDEGLVTSRNPDDLPAFISKVIEEVREGKHEDQVLNA